MSGKMVNLSYLQMYCVFNFFYTISYTNLKCFTTLKSRLVIISLLSVLFIKKKQIGIKSNLQKFHSEKNTFGEKSNCHPLTFALPLPFPFYDWSKRKFEFCSRTR